MSKFTLFRTRGVRGSTYMKLIIIILAGFSLYEIVDDYFVVVPRFSPPVKNVPFRPKTTVGRFSLPPPYFYGGQCYQTRSLRIDNPESVNYSERLCMRALS